MKMHKLSVLITAGVLSSVPGAIVFANDHLGAAAPSEMAGRQIVIDQATEYVNVTRGEIVRFVVAGKTFAWHFNTLGRRSIEFSMIAPKDIPARKLLIYVGPGPADHG